MSSFVEWLADGIEAGYCSLTYCGAHDFPPRPDGQNEDDYDDEMFGDGPCWLAVRLTSAGRDGQC